MDMEKLVAKMVWNQMDKHDLKEDILDWELLDVLMKIHVDTVCLVLGEMFSVNHSINKENTNIFNG